VTPIDRARVAELTERERARLAELLPRSIAFAKRASWRGRSNRSRGSRPP
jgi:hypothetical protein